MKKVELVFKIPDDDRCLNFVVWLVGTYHAKKYLASIDIDDCGVEVVEEDKE